MKRLRRAFVILLALVGTIAATLAIGWRLYRGPDPATILARVDVPPAPVLDPERERQTFRLAPGFRAELVAAEPLVVDPVAIDWDDAGRLYVVEMRGFMPDIDGSGEERPVGRVVVLEDVDRDGRMDESHVFLDGLVLPRAIAVLPQGVLVGVPPDLILCRDDDRNLTCDPSERTRLASYGAEPSNVEHRENRLLPAIDGWIYNAKSKRRFRFTPAGRFVEAPTAFRGQWGIDQDDEGLLYYNHNSAFLHADRIPADYALRQPGTAVAADAPGVGLDLARGELVFGVRVAPGLNRAYQRGSLRPDGRQAAPTAVSGLAIQRGDQYGDAYRGDAYVPESAGNAVAHLSIERIDASALDGATFDLVVEHARYADPDYGEREFLASTDERFRPVDARVGPDGAIWIVDMYRGVIQHAFYVSDYLRDYVARHDLAPPGATGRIWRIVREDRPIDYAPPSLETLGDRLTGLDHPNGWVRDHAARALAASADPEVDERLRAFESFDPRGRPHALWTLAVRETLDIATWRRALETGDASLRRTALRAGESLAGSTADALLPALLRATGDPDDRVRLQALYSLGALPAPDRPLAHMLDTARTGGPLERHAVLSGLAGLEAQALEAAIASTSDTNADWLVDLTPALFYALAREADPRPTVALLDRLTALAHERPNVARALLDGIEAGQRLPDATRVVLEAPHPLFATDGGPEITRGIQRIRRGFTWPGDPRPGGARALTAEEEERRRRGGALYAASCGTCHGTDGRGIQGLAPPLVGSPWVRDSDAWLVRIALEGITGPIRIADAVFDATMPGHGNDPRFDDDALAGVLTFLRRAWGHADEPIAPETVARIRAQTQGRRAPWTVAELLALPASDVDHRLDRFVGRYRVPIVGIELVVSRDGAGLMFGQAEGSPSELVEIGDGVFTGQGVQLRFDAAATGPVSAVEVRFGTDVVQVERVGS